MNVSRFLEIIQVILKLEEEYAIQPHLNKIVTALSNLASQPAQPTHQEALSSVLEELAPKIASLRLSLTPAQLVRIREIGAETYFDENITETVKEWISENAATPATALSKLQDFVAQRQEYLTKIEALREHLVSLGFEVSELKEGQAEIGFMLPRDLFKNNLNGLTAELQSLERTIRVFSEVFTGSIEEVEIRQISTSDPIFFFGLSVPVIVGIGKTITWALDSWKKVEEIRYLRAKTAAVKETDAKKLLEEFDSLIIKSIDDAVQSNLTELLKEVKDKGRRNELKSSIEKALQDVLARVERGMTVEIKFISPLTETTEEGKEPSPPPKEFQTLEHISSELVFPEFTGEPISCLPPPPTTESVKPKVATRKQKNSNPKNK